MGLMTLEHSKWAYRADFALYGSAVLLLAGMLLVAAPGAQATRLVGGVLAGLVLWSAAEYALHRFVLHGVQPFLRWHAQHHQRPAALICTPTLLSATLILTLVFLPALALSDVWMSTALTLGMLTGYLAYATTHHAVHHWRAQGRWLKQRKRCHALHHRPDAPPAYFGVTSGWWDRACGSAAAPMVGAKTSATAVAATSCSS